MKKIIPLFFLMIMSNAGFCSADLYSFKSKTDFILTLKKIDQFISKKGLKIFKTVNHSVNAKSVGLDLPNNVVYIFGNPKVGTPLMQASPTIGIDLPVKLHIHTNKTGDAIVSYNKPESLSRKHNIKPDHASFKKMKKVLSLLEAKLK